MLQKLVQLAAQELNKGNPALAAELIDQLLEEEGFNDVIEISSAADS